MKPVPRSLLAGVAALTLAAPSVAQVAPPPGPPPLTASDAPPYASVADLVIAAPLIIDAAVRSTSRIKGPEAAAVPAGLTRYYVEADVTALVRGAGGVPPRVGYLLDVAPDADGRQPRLKKRRVLLFARPVAGRPGQIQLVTPRAQLDWTPGTDALVRRLVTAVLAPDAPPRVTGVGNAFHVPGSLPGEGETQIFLQTADNRPVSLSILRRPGEQPRWAVALSEIVDDAAAPPARDTLLWYRLACFLPPQLPEASVAQLSPDDAAQARTDYRFVLERLGPCTGRGVTPAG